MEAQGGTGLHWMDMWDLRRLGELAVGLRDRSRTTNIRDGMESKGQWDPRFPPRFPQVSLWRKEVLRSSGRDGD